MALIVVKTVVAFVVLTCTVSATFSEEEWTDVARCRTKCVAKFVDYPISDNKCTTSTDCFMCWQMCEKMVSGTWNYLCEPSFKDMCPAGCRTACDDAIFAGHSSSISDHIDWSFTHPGQTKAPSHDRLLLAWQRPRLHGITDEPTVILYIVMWRHGNKGWKYMYTTSELWAQIDGRHSEYQGLAFRVLAITDNGKIAETSVTYPPKGYSPPLEKTSLLTSLLKEGHHATPQPTVDDSGTHQEDIEDTTSETLHESATFTSFSPTTTSDDVSEIDVTREGVIGTSYTEEDRPTLSTASTEQTTSKSESHHHDYSALSQMAASFYVNISLVLCVLVLVLVLAVVVFKNHRNISRLTKLQADIKLDMAKSLKRTNALGIRHEFPQLTETDQSTKDHSIILVHSAALKLVDSHSPVVINLEDFTENSDNSLTCTAKRTCTPT